MKYLEPSFTVSTARRRISDVDYEIAVGLRCPKCKELFRKCRCATGAGKSATAKKSAATAKSAARKKKKKL